MFEGLVIQVLGGFLRRYVKDFQKNQLKIGIWSEEILLQKVELILEAFEYLQLPFALKNARIGKLSIKIPWRKLGWDPIIVILEDVFLCASQREDSEWSSASVDRRELAGKLAKLNAIELAKFSRRVSDSRTGQSFLSYITAKILDSIEVTVRNVHIVFVDTHRDQERYLFGLRLSSLTILHPQKQSFPASLMRSRRTKVNKNVRISNIVLYCHRFEEGQGLSEDIEEFQSFCESLWVQNDRQLIRPFDVAATVLANKYGNIDGTPQYDINIEMTALVLALDVTLLEQFLSIWDYFTICALRKKYGRFRPAKASHLKKGRGWQTLWWHYAQQSVLADVRGRLKRTSWKHFGHRLNERHRYVRLYKRKLELLQNDQNGSKDILQNILEELEKMDKECDIDDILGYRAIAEDQLQLQESSILKRSASGAKDVSSSRERMQSDDQYPIEARGWLNWLSLGMLGAGGTAETSSFAGVVSDDIIKDIYEGTEFHLDPCSVGDSSLKESYHSSSIGCLVPQLELLICSRQLGRELVNATITRFESEYKVLYDSVDINLWIYSCEMINQHNKTILMANEQHNAGEDLLNRGPPLVNIRIPKDLQDSSSSAEAAILVVVQSFKATFEPYAVFDLLLVYEIITSFQSQGKRVVSSLNLLDDPQTRIYSKMMYISSNRKKLWWDIKFHRLLFKFPSHLEAEEDAVLAITMDLLSVRSQRSLESLKSLESNLFSNNVLKAWANKSLESFLGIHICDLYDQFDVALTNFEVKVHPNFSRVIPPVMKFDASIALSICIFLDEPMLKGLDANFLFPSIDLHISQVICNLFVNACSPLMMGRLPGKNSLHSDDTGKMPYFVNCLLKFGKLGLKIDLGDIENSSIINLIAEDMDFRICHSEFMEVSTLLRAIHITSNDLLESAPLCLLRSSTYCRVSSLEDSSAKTCLSLHYKTKRDQDGLHTVISLSLNDMNLHIHPKLFGQFEEFAKNINHKSELENQHVDLLKGSSCSCVDKIKYNNFSLSSHCNGGSSFSGLSLGQFPFVSTGFGGLVSHGIPQRTGNYIRGGEFHYECSNVPHHVSSLLLDVSLVDIQVHFHDSSCIVATISVPRSLCSLSFINADSWDVLCSVQDILLTSTWPSKNIHELLLGPSSEKIASVLNIRVTKELSEEVLRPTQISLSFVNVSCLLLSEFLSVAIGYFKLPDWHSRACNQQIHHDLDTSGDLESSVLYRFEMLSCAIVIPVEKQASLCVRLDLPQFVGNFIPEMSDYQANIESPLFDQIDIVNLFGKRMSISFVLLTETNDYWIKLNECVAKNPISYVENLDADFQFLIPCKPDLPNEILIKVENCVLISGDLYFLLGREAIYNVLDQFVSIKNDYKLYKGNILQFVLLKRSPECLPAIVISNVSTINLRIYTKKLLVNFAKFEAGNLTWEKIATAYMELNFSATLVSEVPHHMEIDVVSLVLESCKCHILASFKPDGSGRPNLYVKFIKCITGGDEIMVSLPDLDFWLFLNDWNCMVDHVCSYARKTVNNAVVSVPCVHVDDDLDQRNPNLSFDVGGQTETNRSIICENAGISFHLPIREKENQSDASSVEALYFHPLKCSNLLEEQKHCKSVHLSLEFKYCNVVIGSTVMNVKCDVERMKLVFETPQENVSIPFALVSKVKFSLIQDQSEEKPIFCLDFQSESVDVGFSYQTFRFWHNTEIEIPETKSSASHRCVRMKFHLKKGSILLRDGRSSSHGPVMETLMKNVLVQLCQSDGRSEISTLVNFLVNYNNIDKVVWEPFVEPWSFKVNVIRTYPQSVLDSCASMDVQLDSEDQLNINISESVIEAIVRLTEMAKDALTTNYGNDVQGDTSIIFGKDEEVHTRRYSPYVISNETSLPFSFKVLRGPLDMNNSDSFSVIDEKIVPPGYLAPIYIEETLDEFFFQNRESRSSEQLIERKMNAMAHHMISIRFDGTFGASKPMSMDLVGINYFEVNFSGSKPNALSEVEASDVSNISKKTYENNNKLNSNELIVPVVFDVSLQHYSKRIRVYSTVILCNATSVPLELRFDTPFGVSSKVIGPILPNREIPLPLNFPGAGLIRWHPIGPNYLWSEAYPLASLLSLENRPGSMKPNVCCPSHPSNDPFRCCISVHDYSIASAFSAKNHSAIQTSASTQDFLGQPHLRRRIKLSTPFVVKNYLPTCLSLFIDCCGVPHQVSLPEVETASIYLVDATSDLVLSLHIEGYKSVGLKFPRAETFSAAANSNGPKLSLSESIIFHANVSNSSLTVTIEKTVDTSCGTREMVLFVPYLLYNCTDLSLTIVEDNDERTGTTLLIPQSFESSATQGNSDSKEGLGLLSSGNFLSSLPQAVDTDGQTFLPSTREADKTKTFEQPRDLRGVKAYMFSPSNLTPNNELLIKLNVCPPASVSEVTRRNWSIPFSLVPAGGSTNVTVPQENNSGTFLICVESVPLSVEFLGRTRAIAFQPRYVICNACSCDLFYRQAGTRSLHRLGSGKHSFLHSSDSARVLLVSIRFDGPGWQWSGSFPPDRLGDTQLRMRNNVSGDSSMVRVEVQNADLSPDDEKMSGKTNISSTQLILLSDDKTDFVPYRIDNFSTEKLRIYQQKCEHLETVVYPYSSCQYAWDEPCYPHRLVVEVPGKQILGTYSLEIMKEYVHVDLPGNNEKPGRNLCISVHAEGAIKVLSVIDSGSHTITDLRETGFLGFKDHRDVGQNEDLHMNFTRIIRLRMPFIGVSLLNSSPQELLYLSVKGATLVAMQNLNEQKMLIQISSLQVDNQLPDTQFPIMLSFDGVHRGKSGDFFIIKDADLKRHYVDISGADVKLEPAFQFSAARWSVRDASFVSYQNINISIAPVCIELEERVVLSVLELLRAVSCRIHAKSFPDDAESVVEYHKVDCVRYTFLTNSIHIEDHNDKLLPIIHPFGAPWQEIFLLARRQKKLYVELFELAPIYLSLSFTSTPWLARSEAALELNINNGVTAIQRGLMALIDVEDVSVYLGEVKLENLMASWQSIQDILVKHYTRQIVREIYKVFGSAGVIGNPVGFARNVGYGLRDFLSSSSKGVLQSPAGLLNGIGRGSASLIANTVYAISSATSQFSKTAHKGLVAFTYDDQGSTDAGEPNKQLQSHGKGVLNGFLEGLTGLLQSPIRGAEKHGLPGIISGIAIGTAGLVARPMASILEATEKTAQSIRNKSNPHKFDRLRVRLPRPLARDLPLMPYSWEEAVGVSLLQQADNGRFSDETFAACKMLQQNGKFLVLTERLILIVMSPWLVELGGPNFAGVPCDPKWMIETEMHLDCIVHLNRSAETVNIVGSSAETSPRGSSRGGLRNSARGSSASTPLIHVSVPLPNEVEAADAVQVIQSVSERGRMHRRNLQVLHRRNITGARPPRLP